MEARPDPVCNPKAKTAVILVSGYNGLGLHTLLGVMRVFGGVFKNFVFVQVGIIDAGNFKGTDEIDRLRSHVLDELEHYVDYMREHGHYAEGFYGLGTDVVEEVGPYRPEDRRKIPQLRLFRRPTRFPEGYLCLPLASQLHRLRHPKTLLPRRLPVRSPPHPRVAATFCLFSLQRLHGIDIGSAISR